MHKHSTNKMIIVVLLILFTSENRINNDPGVQTVLSEISTIRKALTELQHYDTISVPLVYTQVRC